MFPPGLSMLWEPTDPARALRERFGHDGFDAAADWLRQVLAGHWGLELTACERVLLSDDKAIAWVQAGGQLLVAKWSTRTALFERLAAGTELLAALHGHGVPVAPPLPAVDGRRRVVADGPRPASVAVQPHVRGDHLDGSDSRAVRAAGACLARLHLALARTSDDRLAATGPFAPDLRARVEGWLEHADDRFPDAVARLRTLLAAAPEPDTAPQLVHGDFRAANVLVAGAEVTAVLDFDEVRLDHCVSDLAQSLVVLTTLFHDWAPTPPGVRQTFLDGYATVRPLSAGERAWLPALVLLRAVHAVPPGDDPTGWARAL